jgi:hypothetical protein
VRVLQSCSSIACPSSMHMANASTLATRTSYTSRPLRI